MNVYVRELALELGRMGVAIDVFTRSQNPAIPRVVRVAERTRVVHVTAGPEEPMPREGLVERVADFVEAVDAWRIAHGAYDLIHAHYWLSGVAALALRVRWTTPVLQMFHTLGRLKNRVAAETAEREPLVRIAHEQRIIADADRIVAANVVERRDLEREYGADLRRIAVIPCGVDTGLFAPQDRAAARRRLGLDDRPMLLYVGRIAPIKGLDTLLDAVARLVEQGSQTRLLVIGGEADEPSDGLGASLRARSRLLGIEDQVLFLGAQPQDVLPAYYAAADATVLPSHYESFGMVALEAMACGSPVIASRVGGLTTTVQDGVTGFLVPEGDVGALAARIAGLLTDPTLARRIGREGVRWAAGHRWPCVAEAVCREYALLATRARAHLATARCR